MAAQPRSPSLRARGAAGPRQLGHRRRRRDHRGRPRHRQPRHRRAPRDRARRPDPRPELRRNLRAARVQDDQLRPARVPRRARRPPRPLPPPPVRLDAGRAGAVRDVRRPDGDRGRQRPPVQHRPRGRPASRRSRSWSRLNRIQDVNGIGETIVSEATGSSPTTRSASTAWTTPTQLCEPIAFHGEFLGIGTPTPTCSGCGSARA